MRARPARQPRAEFGTRKFKVYVGPSIYIVRWRHVEGVIQDILPLGSSDNVFEFVYLQLGSLPFPFVSYSRALAAAAERVC